MGLAVNQMIDLNQKQHFRAGCSFDSSRKPLPFKFMENSDLSGIVAERQGFEPWVPVKVQRISNPPRSSTPAPLQRGNVLCAASKGLDRPVQA